MSTQLLESFSEPEAKAIMELEYYECTCGFHFALDATFLLQVGDINFECPSCKRKHRILGG